MNNLSYLFEQKQDGWSLYADCEVLYDGRASSTLRRGHYLIIYKKDKSISIHGATMTMPRNYLSGSTNYTINNSQILFECKKEIIKITIHETISFTRHHDWSEAKPLVCRTEKELAAKIFNNWSDYFDDDFEIIQLEIDTELGKIDILGATLTTDYIVEVKRKAIVIKDVTQLLRYVEARSSSGRIIKGFLAAPDISKRALAYLEKHGLSYLQVEF